MSYKKGAKIKVGSSATDRKGVFVSKIFKKGEIILSFKGKLQQKHIHLGIVPYWLLKSISKTPEKLNNFT